MSNSVIDALTAQLTALPVSESYAAGFFDDVREGRQYGSPTPQFNYADVQAVAQQIRDSGETLINKDGKYYDTGNAKLNEALYGVDIANNLSAQGPGFRTPRNLKTNAAFELGKDVIQGIATGGALGAAGAGLFGPGLVKAGQAAGGTTNTIAGGGSMLGNVLDAAGTALTNAPGIVAGTTGAAEFASDTPIVDSLFGLTGSGITPYETGVMPGPAPDDFRDNAPANNVVYGGAAGSIPGPSQWRYMIDVGLPIPSWGMKWEDLKNLPGDVADYIKGVLSGSENPLEDLKDWVVGIPDKVLGDVTGAIQAGVGVLDAVFSAVDGGDPTALVQKDSYVPPQPPVGGIDPNIDEPGYTWEDWRNAKTQPVDDPFESTIPPEIGDTVADDPVGYTWADWQNDKRNPPELGPPTTTTTTDSPLDNPLGGTSGGGGGGGGAGGAGSEFDPFMAVPDFQWQLEQPLRITPTDYLAAIMGGRFK